MKAGDLGSRNPWSDFWERVDPLVRVRGCDIDRYESTLLVKLGGRLGEGAPTFAAFASTASGEEALGAPMLK